jgi:hypothetical protein
MKSLLASSDQVVADRFDSETFLVNFRNGRYYAMRGSATEIWTLLQNPQTAESIIKRLARTLGKLPSEATSEVSSFLDQLEAEGLASHSQTPPAAEIDDLKATNDQGYQSPVLEIFDDLSELIVIDPMHEVDNERGWPVQPAT